MKLIGGLVALAIFATAPPALAGIVYYNDTTTALGASATFYGPARTVGFPPGSVGWTNQIYGATFYSDQNGTAYIDASNDGVTWVPVSTASLVGGTALNLTTTIATQYYRTRVVNAGTAESTLNVNSSFIPAPSSSSSSGSGGSSYSPVVPNSFVAINTASGATVQLVAPVSGQKVYVSSWDVIASGTTTVTLEYGTGTNCGTGTTALTGPYALTAQVGLAPSGGYGPMFVIPASNALCIVNGSAVQISGRVSYAQQ